VLLSNDILFRVLECDRQTDGRTDGRTVSDSVQSMNQSVINKVTKSRSSPSSRRG